MNCCSGPPMPAVGPQHSIARLCQKCCCLLYNWTSTFSTTKSHLSLFGHVVCMDGKADANQVLFESTPELWRIPPGWLRSIWLKNITDDPSFELETRDAAQDWGLLRGCWHRIALSTHSDRQVCLQLQPSHLPASTGCGCVLYTQCYVMTHTQRHYTDWQRGTQTHKIR